MIGLQRLFLNVFGHFSPPNGQKEFVLRNAQIDVFPLGSTLSIIEMAIIGSLLITAAQTYAAQNHLADEVKWRLAADVHIVYTEHAFARTAYSIGCFEAECAPAVCTALSMAYPSAQIGYIDIKTLKGHLLPFGPSCPQYLKVINGTLSLQSPTPTPPGYRLAVVIERNVAGRTLRIIIPGGQIERPDND